MLMVIKLILEGIGELKCKGLFYLNYLSHSFGTYKMTKAKEESLSVFKSGQF